MIIDECKSYLLVSLLGLYITGTVLASVIIVNSHQDDVIKNQQDTIIYLTSELIEKEQILTEIESDSRMIQELGK